MNESPANCSADPKPGSISSLRCQITRTSRPSGLRVRIDVSRTIMSRLKAAHRSSTSSGGARRDRTDDLMLAKHALSQLSYGPVPEDECFLGSARYAHAPTQRPSFKKACRAEAAEQRRLVGLGRLELPTSRLSSARSNQLSYKPLTLILLGLEPARAHPAQAPTHRTSAKPLARVRPRRKRNVDGEVPPMELNRSGDRLAPRCF